MREDILVLSESELHSYNEFVSWADVTDFGNLKYEGKLSDTLYPILQFVKEFALKAGLKLAEMIKVFLDKYVFSFFSKFGWSFDKFINTMKSAYKTWQQITHFIPDLIASLAKQGIDLVVDVKKKEKIKSIVKGIENWINAHPILKKISGILFACLLIVIWINMSSVGDPLYDFDLSDVVAAVLGHLTIFSFFSSEDGIKTLVLLALGMIGFSLPMFSGPINIIIAVVGQFAKSLRVRLSKGSSGDISRELAVLNHEVQAEAHSESLGDCLDKHDIARYAESS